MKPILWNPSVADYLRTLGASERVIAFIDSQSDRQVQSKLANEVRKKPDIKYDELVAFVKALPKKRELDGWEEFLVGNSSIRPEVINKWFAHQLPKLRTGRMFAAGFSYFRSTWGTRTTPVGYHAHDFGLVGIPIETSALVSTDRPLWNELHEWLRQIDDWVRATHVDIWSYSWHDAIRASNEWHEQVVAAGGGTVYEPQDPELITYQFADGWKLVAVMSESDLDVEGNLMKHCVGSYADQVADGRSRILSLRDPQNKPHVTAEFDKDWMLQQVQGVANSKPKDEYKARLKEAFAAMLKAGMPLSGQEDYWYQLRDDLKESSARGMVEALERFDEADEYGLPGEPLHPATFEDIVETATNTLFYHNPDYGGSMRSVAYALGELAFKTDWAKGSIQVHAQRGDPVKFSYFDEKENMLPVIYGIMDSDNEFCQNNNFYDERMPDEDDYEDKKEFEKVLEEWQEREREWLDEIMEEGSFGFHGDIFKAYKAAAEKAGVVFER